MLLVEQRGGGVGASGQTVQTWLPLRCAALNHAVSEMAELLD